MVPGGTCKLCSSLGAKTKYLTLDDRKTHAQFHAFQSGYISVDGEQTSVKQVFGKCFPLEYFEELQETDKTRSSLIKICKRIIADKIYETKSIECQICGSNVQYINNKGFPRTDLILRHACYHSTMRPFVCRECKHESADKSDIVGHVKKIHKIASPVSGLHFDENWLVCFEEVKESLTQSFYRSNLVQNLRTPRSELAIQRRLVFKNIISKRASTAKKVRCDQCRTEICAKGVDDLEKHICVHLQQRIYECSMCDSKFIHKCSVMKHLVKNHGARPKGNYIDHSDEHHEAIMELMEKCYGKEEDK